MSKFWSSVVHELVPYVPGEQPKVTNLIKLNTNENPYPPSPAVLDAISKATDLKLRLYPDPNSELLKEKIASYFQLKTHQVFVGNGSDEVLGHVFQAFFQKNTNPILFPDITYSFYPVYSKLYQVKINQLPLKHDFSIDIEDYMQTCGGIIFPNPNAPTGKLLAIDAIETLSKHHRDNVVVIDEAYVDFGGESAVTLIHRCPNILVVQTLSKSRSLAGLRIGYALGNAELIEGLERVKNSFNSYPIDRLAEVGAVAAFDDEAYFQRIRKSIIETRTKLEQELMMLGFECIPSAANFVLAKHQSWKAEAIFKHLRQHNILVRYWSKPRIEDYLRITVGTDQECEALVDALKLYE